MKKIELDKALLMVRRFDEEMAEQISVAINSHEELLAAAKHFKECRETIDVCDDCYRSNKAIAKAEARP